MPPSVKHEMLPGDALWQLAVDHAQLKTGAEFTAALLSMKLPRHRYVGFICSMYPIVVGFNRALIRSISKVDHVRQSAFVSALAEQLQEEQRHNQLWRAKLSLYGVNHDALYFDLEEYLSRFTRDQLDQMTLDVIAALSEDIYSVRPNVFPESPFPEPVLALYHRLWTTADSSDVDYWEHYAGQTGIEMLIFDIVSTTIYPGVEGNPQLNIGPAALQWWKEHSQQGCAPGKRSAEEKHLRLARVAFNKSGRAKQILPQILSSADDTLRLFTATWMCQNNDRLGFFVNDYIE